MAKPIPAVYLEELRNTQGWKLVEKEINEVVGGLENGLINVTPDTLIEVREKQSKLRAYKHVLFLINGK